MVGSDTYELRRLNFMRGFESLCTAPELQAGELPPFPSFIISSGNEGSRPKIQLPPLHFPNQGRESGVSAPENFWNSICDLVHFEAIWWQL